MPVRHRRETAITLAARDWKENDRLVYLLTQDSGVVDAVARGAKRSRKRFGGSLEPFQVVQVELHAGTHGRTLSECTISRAYPALRSDPLALEILMHAAAMLVKRHHPLGALFKPFHFLLHKLDSGIGDADKVKFYLFFLVCFLKLEGLLGSRLQCGACGAGGGTEFFVAGNEHFELLCSTCAVESSQTLSTLSPATRLFADLALRESPELNRVSLSMSELRTVFFQFRPILNTYLQMQVPVLLCLS